MTKILVLSLIAAAGVAAPLRAASDSTCAARSSNWLALLPDGLTKRAFIIDCTNCHQFGAQQARPNGRPRTEAQWDSTIQRMLAYAGARTGFPIISAGRDPALTARWLATSLGARVPGAPCALSGAGVAEVTEYLMPEPRDLPHDVAVDGAGNVLVTGMMTHQLYRLAAGARQFTEIAIPVERANPRAIELDGAGNAWVVLGNPHQLARRTADGAWRTWDVGMYAHSLAIGANGRVWFNGHFTRQPEQIGWVEEGGAVRTVDVPPHPLMAEGPGGPIPYELRVAPDGKVWMSELQGNRIVGYDPASGRFTVRDMPLGTSAPRRFDIDQRGVLWIPAFAANQLVSYDPATDRFETIPLPVADAVPYVVRIDPGTGLIWIGTSAADAVLSFDPRSRRFTTYSLPTPGAMIRHMAIDPRNHDVWLAYGASPGIPARVARLRPM